jgi:hypothetical protein
MFTVFALVACSNDFAVQKMIEPDAVDTALPDDSDPPVDTDTPDDDTDSASWDTGTIQEDTDVPEDTDAPPEVDDDPPPADDCTETDDLIYALSRDDGTLYTFDPSSLVFASVGRVSCPTTYTAASMSVRRDGTMYVRYGDDKVYSVDLDTMNCTATAYSDRATRFDSFGMGYSTDSADTWRDQLYVANGDTVGVLDTSSWTITPIGGMPSQSELTGNADGELWAVLPLESPAKIIQIDKTDGSALTTIPMRSFPEPVNIDTFAFATWGGDFYVFVGEHGFGRTTDVYEVTATGTMTKVLADIGFDVVGAGVSTCAPS